MYCAPEPLTLENSGEKSDVCASKNSVARTSAPASVAPFFSSGTRSCTHLAFSPTIAIFSEPQFALDEAGDEAGQLARLVGGVERADTEDVLVVVVVRS